MSDFHYLLLNAAAPRGHPATDKVLFRWADHAMADPVITAEARQCLEHTLPFEAHDKTWRVTWCGLDETDCFAIEGVEWA